MIKVSIIMAVYNVEDYISKALDSVINQTLKDIEIIVIDNKSTDRTSEIVKEYKKKDKRIILHENTSNLKQGLARNFGIKMASGDYICFLDGDDYYSPDAVEKFYNRITQTDADITLCCFDQIDCKTEKICKFDNYTQLAHISNEFDNKTFNWKDIKPNVFEQTSVPWDKIYKRSFLVEKDVKFPGEIFFEDNVFVYDALLKADKISILRENLIHYRCNRKDSIMNSKNRIYFDYFKIFDFMEVNMRKIGVYNELKVYLLSYQINTLFYFFKKIKFMYKSEYYYKMKYYFNNIIFSEEDKNKLYKSTKCIFNRIKNLHFLVYYPFVFLYDEVKNKS